MYLRETRRRNADGSVANYLALAHNERDPVTGTPKARVIHNFGRAEQVDRAALGRLVASISRVLDPAQATAAAAPGGVDILDARPMGTAYVADRLWERLGVGAAIRRVAAGRRVDTALVERVIFAMVANRLCPTPLSKLAGAAWVSERVFIDGLPALSDDACYRGMDFLLDALPALQEEVFFAVANLLNLEVDLLFFDGSSTYWEREGADAELLDGHGDGEKDGEPDDAGAESPVEAATRRYGRSKDHRGDLPQVVIGLAVTREGIPVRLWTFPGDTSEQLLLRTIKDDLRAWNLNRVIWVLDRGFASAANRRYLRSGDHHYIIGEKLRSNSPEIKAALSRQGRYQDIAHNMRVKEVKVSEAERFVICHNPEGATRDAAIRTQLITQLTELIEGSDALSDYKRGELRGKIAAKPGLNRYLRTTPAGKLRIDATKAKAEANLDGKYLLRCSDPKLSAEDIALGYKQLLEVERGWRDMKQILDLRPVYHRLEERIRAHVILCWLALLLVRIVETTTADTWNRIREDLQELHVGTFEGLAGTFRQRTELTTAQRDILTKLGIDPPKKIIELGPPASS